MALNVKGNVLSSTDITSVGVFKSKVNRDGLICYLDAANLDSYPGSGTTWYDLSGTGNSPTITGAGWTTVGSRTAFNFTTDGNVISGSFTNGATTEGTLEAWLYPAAAEITAGDRGTVILTSGGSSQYMSWEKTTRYLSSYWYSHSPEGYHESNGPSSRSAWHYWCSVWDNKDIYQWVDGTLGKVNNISGTSTANNNLIIGRESSGRQFAGAIAIVRIYNRALSPFEVAENFQAERGRFGL